MCTSFYKRIITSVKLSRVYSRGKKSYRLKDDGTWWLLSVSISFITGATATLPISSVRVFLSPSTHPHPQSHSIRPSRLVVTALRLYKFYIIFMRHKVVEKPTKKRRERVRLRVVRRRGSFSVRIAPRNPLSPPLVGVVVTWLGGADRTPSCSLVGVGYEERGKPTM